MLTDEYFMRQAMAEAQQALAEGEIPIGAVVVLDNTTPKCWPCRPPPTLWVINT
jgi:tRNA(Arg) A34 adenosine deaminase TadA